LSEDPRHFPGLDPSEGVIPFGREEIERPIAERFERIAAEQPDSPAIVTPERVWTYGELNREANRLARAILATGAAPDRFVALFLHHGYSQVVGLMATIKAGRPYLPLDAADPPDRTAYMIEDSEAGLIVADGRTLESARALATDPGLLLNVDEPLDGYSDANLARDVSPDALGGVFYTSGTSGQPKGVLQSHRGLKRHAWLGAIEFGLRPDDRLAATANFSLLVGTGDILRPLLSGGAICPYDIRERGVAALPSWLQETGITLWRCVPTLFRNIAAAIHDPGAFSSIRVFSLAGEPTSRRDVELSRRVMPDRCRLRVSYGATEAAGGITTYYLDKESPLPDGVVPVGYPVPNIDVMILDDEGKPVDAGGTGELIVRSRYLSPGYWRRPALTAERFYDDPSNPTLRCYRTGDLGRQRPDGCLELLGRKDFLAKVRGLRIELAEVEAALLNIAAIRQAVVTVQPDPFGDNRLVAYLVAEDGPMTVRQLNETLGRHLPQHMTPGAYVFLPDMPMTAAGKPDRAALPAPSPERPLLDVDFHSERNEIEGRLRKVWERILDVRPIGVKDNFFELGGHSLAAARLISAVEEEFGRGLPLIALLESPTIEALAARLGDQEWAPPRSPLVELQASGDLPPLFCVEAKNAGIFVHLARRLGARQPVYGLHPLGLPAADPSQVTIQGLATSYLKEVRRIQPHGPYRLCGLCAGGTVAFEMAMQLQAAGETVAFLALFDGFIPRRVPLMPSAALRFFARMKRRPQRRAQRKRTTPEAPRVGEAAADRYLEQMAAYSKLMRRGNRRAIFRYRPGQFKGRILLFMGEEGEDVPDERSRTGWIRHATEGAAVRAVSGIHEDMLREPYVAEVARLVQEHLSEAEGA
jgi:amino acid adenylation domain-containing protein